MNSIPTRPVLARAVALAALGLLSACGPVEFIASGISDGTKFVLDRAERHQQGTGAAQPASTAPQAPTASPAVAPARQPAPEAAPPATAAPVPKVGRPEAL